MIVCSCGVVMEKKMENIPLFVSQENGMSEEEEIMLGKEGRWER